MWNCPDLVIMRSRPTETAVTARLRDQAGSGHRFSGLQITDLVRVAVQILVEVRINALQVGYS